MWDGIVSNLKFSDGMGLLSYDRHDGTCRVGELGSGEPMDEVAAVAASKTGDRRAFGLLVDQYYKGIYRFAYHCTGSHPDADDICQETFARALDKIDGLRDGQNFRGWIFAIAANLVRRQVSRGWRVRRVAESEELDCAGEGQGPAQCLTIEEEAARVRRELETMPEAVRMAVVLAFMEGHSQKETAAIIGCSEPSVSRYLESARTQLRARLKHLRD
jgi:RNA polymerase sigma-70 factor, ECF subfamily